MPRRSLRGKRGIITGASSGIGAELARLLAADGVRLLLTARRADRLAELAAPIQQQGGEAHFLPGDLTLPQTRTELVQRAEELWGGLDLVVNNAGIGALGPFAAADPQRLRTIMEVNFFAPAELTRVCLPLLRRGQQPIIVNIGSVLGHRAVPLKSEYSASKFALHGWTDALRAELSREGIDVLLVSPSTTSTEFFEAALGEANDPARHPQQGKSAVYVARQTVRAIQRGSHEIILTLGGKLLVWADRLCPPLANWLVARYGQG